MKSTFPFLKHKAILAPMSGVSHVAFRELCKELGAGLTVTEFISSAAITRGNQISKRMMEVSEIEEPVSCQLFGNSVEEIVKAAKIVEPHFDIIDINVGCPAYKVVRTGAGSALLSNPQKIKEIVTCLVAALRIPITVKIRAGVSSSCINAIEVAKVCEEAGAAAITVHPRTAQQGYSGKADWSIIKAVKQAVSIPVIGNGDIKTAHDAKRMLEETGCDYVMIGRAARANPFIFFQINSLLERGEEVDDLKFKEKIELTLRYLRLGKAYDIKPQAIISVAQAFTHGYPHSSDLRQKMLACKTLDELERFLEGFLSLLK